MVGSPLAPVGSDPWPSFDPLNGILNNNQDHQTIHLISPTGDNTVTADTISRGPHCGYAQEKRRLTKREQYTNLVCGDLPR